VNPQESDIFSNKVSVDSPVGRVLLNKKIGEIVRLKTPAGQVRYEIIGIRTE